MRSAYSCSVGKLRSGFTFVSGCLALLAFGIHCGSSDSSLFGGAGGCPPALADKCGSQCTLDSDCAEGVHCGLDNVCVAQCAPGSTCENGLACSPRGRCGSDPGSGLSNATVDGGGSDGNTDSVCAATDVQLTKVLPKVLFLLDQSSSMWKYKFPGNALSDVAGVECANGCRWTVLKDVLIGPNPTTGGLLKELQGEAELGIQMYSATDPTLGDGDDSYLPASPAPAATCPRFNGKAFTGTTFALNNADAMDGLLRPATVDDDTPTGPAITKVVGLGADGGVADPNGLAADTSPAPKVIVLVTDGEPGLCGANNTSETAKAGVVAAVQLAHTHGIKTFVIAIGDPSAHFKAVANAGQGKDPTTGDSNAITPTSTNDLKTALTNVVLGARTCKFQLNGEVQPGMEKQGTVTLNGGVVPFDDPGAPDEGWRLVGKSEIELVGAACNTVKTTPDAKLSASFPCGTILPLGPR